MKQERSCFVVKDILPNVIAKLSSSNIHDQINLENAWNKVAQGDCVGVVYAGFKNGCIFINVDTPTRLYQWKLKKTTLLKRFNTICPEVKNISFKLGKVK